MAKEKVTITLTEGLAALVDRRAGDKGMNRSQYIEDLISRDDDARVWAEYAEKTVPALGLDEYAATLAASMKRNYGASDR
ncbi:ribbon-helix-helix CopG family protein [Stackebrandtia albiflava]|uniref:Ribbon-helix-helix CopG family protein n=1 Tax=Stackebrandtia albiflava TaxID=406432 RepID=A0A562V2X3_9ACTN|nr:ribbon-helix-helix protein, CopG family [Stackebrandtia albiflava]TWJ12193.1 ribbon-helix-helix CopG family protein [Stackebrandtia albiflava]